jgi:hypothetical protein
LVLALTTIAGCSLVGLGSKRKMDLSKVVLQQDEVPAEFSNPSVFGDQAIGQFFPLGEDDAIDNYYGVSYLYPKDGINLIYSVVAVFDDEESASDVYKNVTGQVNSQLHHQKNKFGDESLVFTTLSGTSIFSIWRNHDKLGFIAVVTRLPDAGFGIDDVVAASKLVEARLSD